MASQEDLEVKSLSQQLVALKKEASNRSVPDARLNRRIAEIQDMIGRKKSATLATPNAVYKKGGVVKKKPVKKMAQGGMTKKQTAKVGKVMGEFKEGTLHSGKKGPVVKNPKQAVAIALSEARKVKKK
jgi:hypothetical protein